MNRNMLKAVCVGIITGLFVCGAGFGEDKVVDAIGDLSAKDAFLKASDNLAKTEGYHLKMAGAIAMMDPDNPLTVSADGIVKNPDFAYAKVDWLGGMQFETVKKGENIVVKSSDTEWCPPESMGIPANFKQFLNPQSFLEMVKKHAETAQWIGEAKIGEVDCKKLSMTPSEESMKEIIKGFGLPDMGIDWKKTTLVCLGFISKDDLMLRKFEINAEIVVW